MTCIAAIKQGNQVWLGTDSMSADSGRWNIDLGSSDHSKIVEFRYFSVAIAGSWTVRDALEVIKKSNPSIKIKDKHDARKFAAKVYKKLKFLYEQGTSTNKEEWMSCGSFIICTKHDIFKVQGDMSIFICDRYTTEGAGDLMCSTIIEALYDTLAPKEVLEKALQVTCKLNMACAEPLDIRRIK